MEKIMDLKLESDADQVAALTLAGPVTQAQVSMAHEPVSQLLGATAYNRTLLLDLGHAEHIDSTGLNWLLILHRRTREAGGRLVLHSIPPLVDNVLKVLRLNLVFEIAPNKEAAQRLIAGGAA
jgi:anti-sigma B factor antagonist